MFILIGPIYLLLLFIISDMLNFNVVVLDVSYLFYLFSLYVSCFDANSKKYHLASDRRFLFFPKDLVLSLPLSH